MSGGCGSGRRASSESSSAQRRQALYPPALVIQLPPPSMLPAAPARLRAWILTAVALAGVATVARAQGRVDDALLSRKRLFAEQQLAALAQPFVGVHTAAGVAPGLFPIRATGVSDGSRSSTPPTRCWPRSHQRRRSARSSPSTTRSGGAGRTSTTASTPVRASACARCRRRSAMRHGAAAGVVERQGPGAVTEHHEDRPGAARGQRRRPALRRAAVLLHGAWAGRRPPSRGAGRSTAII